VAGGFSGVMSGLTGAGGGIILIPVLARFTTMSQQTINGTQAGAVAFSVLLGAYNYIQVDACNVPLALVTAMPSVVFAGIGVRAAHYVSSKRLSLAVGTAMLACAPVMMFRNSPRFPKLGGSADALDLQRYRSASHKEYIELIQQHPADFVRVNLKYIAAGCLAAFISGLVGIGGGILVTAYLTAASEMPQEAIIGTSMLSILPTAASAAYFNFRAQSMHVPTAVRLSGALGLSVFLTSKYVTHHLPDDVLRDLLGGTLGTAALVMLRRGF
jgi:uncharacterized protein